MTKINIAYAATQDWFKYTIISISSILFNSKVNNNYHFFIMSNSFSEDDKKNFLKLNNIKNSEFTFLTMDDSEYEKIFKNSLGNATNYRLKLASATDVDKILYLDSDTLVLDDISELYDTKIENYYIAGIEDKCSQAMRFRITDDLSFKFINAGVVLMNLKKFRENDLEQKMFKYLEAKCEEAYCDQDAINAVCINNIKYLPIKYNLMVGGFWTVSYDANEFEEAIKAPLIAHFVVKPWNDKYYSTPFSLDWLKYKEKFEELSKD